MKHLHYLMIASGLTGDSEIRFYNTAEQAKSEYDKIVKPIVDAYAEVGIGDEHEENNTMYFYTTDNGIRFYGGVHKIFDDLYSDVDHYFEYKSVIVPDGITHYLANFSEHVDESTVNFYSGGAYGIYDNRINDQLQSLNMESETSIVDRINPTTWKGEDDLILFDETSNYGIKQAYIYNEDCAETYMVAEIETINPNLVKLYIVYVNSQGLIEHKKFIFDKSNENDINYAKEYYSSANLSDNHILTDEEFIDGCIDGLYKNEVIDIESNFQGKAVVYTEQHLYQLTIIKNIF